LISTCWAGCEPALINKTNRILWHRPGQRNNFEGIAPGRKRRRKSEPSVGERLQTAYEGLVGREEVMFHENNAFIDREWTAP